MYALLISIYTFKALISIKIVQKLSYFSKKMQNFQMLGALPPDLLASGSGGFAPKATPHYKFLATHLTVAGIAEC